MKKFFIFVVVVFLSGCSINDYRELSKYDRDLEQKNRISRVNSIQNGRTIYSEKLECISDNFAPGKKIDIAVSPILDKTGKVYQNVGQDASTALTDMVINALAKTQLFEVIDYPSTGKINTSFASQVFFDKYPNLLPGSDTLPLVYAAAPTANRYITGALIQYDEASDIPSDQSSININIEPLTISQEKSVVTVGLNLRMVNLPSGRITTRDGKPISVLLTNRFITLRQSANLFKVVSDDTRDVSYDVSVSDPKHYAVMEIVDKAVFEMMADRIDGIREVCGQ